jgi:hypothetical protein
MAADLLRIAFLIAVMLAAGGGCAAPPTASGTSDATTARAGDAPSRAAGAISRDEMSGGY